MTHTVSKLLQEMMKQPSPIRQIMKMASIENIINMGLDPDELISYGGGWVDHLAPQAFRESYAKICCDEHQFHTAGKYSPTLGMPECLTEITHFEKKLFGYTISDKNVIIGNSSTQLTHDLFITLADPGDSILLLDPTYANYPGQIKIALPKSKIIYLPVLNPETWEYLPSPTKVIEQFKHLVSQHQPKIILFSSPDNPSGQLLPMTVVKAIMDIATDEKSYVVVDYAYKTQCFDKPPKYFSWSPNDYPNLITIHSNSKWCHGLGRRLGWMEASPGIIDAMERTQQCSILCPDTFHQVAMAHYLHQSLKDGTLKRYLNEAKRAYKTAAQVTVEGIKEHLDMPYLSPQGGLYTLMKTNEDGNKFVERVLRATGVLFIPGNGFGSTLAQGVRISYGPLVRTTEKITQGLSRVGNYIKGRDQ